MGSDSARVKVKQLVVVDVAAVFVNANQLFSSTPISCFCLRRVVRHPDQPPLPSLWAHHEKMVVVDQSAVLFMQGSAAS
jgi:hypothetical protein